MKVNLMRSHVLLFCLGTALLHSLGGACLSADSHQKEKAAIAFGNVKYLHRFTQNDQHEYTPAGQEDLEAWKDMVTIHYYRHAKDGDALAAIANGTLGNYKAAKGVVIRTDSVPRTNAKAAEHLIVVLFLRPEFMETAFARFRMHGGVGTAVIYSHRTYGKNAGNEMSAWLEKNGPATEQTLMKWDAMPK
jgi:hypothetical protein